MNRFLGHATPRRKRLLLAGGIVAGAIVIMAAWYVLPPLFFGRPVYPPYIPGYPTPAQQKAIDAALQWRGNQGILSGSPAFTHAVNPRTGARYTFPDSDLPPGWVEDN